MSDVSLDCVKSVERVHSNKCLSGELAVGDTSLRPTAVAMAAAQSNVDQFLADSHVGQSETFSRTLEALAQVRNMKSVVDVLSLSPEIICTAGSFDRALISHVRGSTWIPHVAYSTSPPANAGSTPVAPTPMMLSSAHLEAEVVRRRTTARVCAHDNRRDDYGSIFGDPISLGYIVAPVTVAGSVSGLLHVDNHRCGRVLSEADRDIIRIFAEGLGFICERMLLSERIREQQRSMSAAFTTAESVIEEVHFAPTRLAPPTVAGLQPHRLRDATAEARDPAAPTSPTEARFTAREMDVLELLLQGCTNSDAARRLSISESTVKSHVKHIHRKLGVTNRAAAIAKYARITQSRRLRVG